MNLVNTFDQIEGYLKITDLENFFNVYQDKNGNYYFNLNSSVYVNIPKDLLQVLDIDYDCHWPLISYKLYNTPRLAWLLMKINGVTTKDLFNIKHAGDKIYYPSQEQVQIVLNYINSFDVDY